MSNIEFAIAEVQPGKLNTLVKNIMLQTGQFDPKMIAENLQHSGAFIPGIRPGEHTQNHIANIVTRITLVGALFLGIVAILPLIISAFSGGDRSIAIGGTALLIVVSVVLDLLKKIDAQVAMREY